MQVLSIVKRVSPQIRAPIVIFLYFNPILYRTIDKMCQQLADSGAKGEPLSFCRTIEIDLLCEGLARMADIILVGSDTRSSIHQVVFHDVNHQRASVTEWSSEQACMRQVVNIAHAMRTLMLLGYSSQIRKKGKNVWLCNAAVLLKNQWLTP